MRSFLREVTGRLVASARGQGGFLLIGVFTTITVMGIMSGVAVQEWTIVEQRDKEQDLIFIQEQYAAAVLAYQQDQGGLPSQLEQLTKKGQKGQVYIRKKFVDPMTRDAKLEDWCLLRIGGANRVVSSCAAEGAAEGEGPGLGLSGGSGGRGSGGGEPGQFGLGGAKGKLGEESSGTRTRAMQGVAPGGVGIVGVHSKSRKKAFNIVKRSEQTYDRWYYTMEDYRKEVAARSIPGLQQGKGPGFGGNQGGLNQGPGSSFGGSKGGSSFGGSNSGSGSGRGGGGGRRNN